MIQERPIKARAHKTKVPDHIKARVVKAIMYYWDLLKLKGFAVGKYPTVSYDLRGTCAGQAFTHVMHVALNPQYLLANEDQYIEDTIPHELAHLANSLLFSGRGHGESWRRLAVLMGSPGEVRHSMKAPDVRKTITYVCDCREHEMSILRHNRAKKGIGYICRKCKTPLQIKRG